LAYKESRKQAFRDEKEEKLGIFEKKLSKNLENTKNSPIFAPAIQPELLKWWL